MAQRYLNAEAWRSTLENLTNIHSNFLIPLLEIWNGDRGALRFSKYNRELIITIRDRRTTDILSSMGFLVLMDSTLDKETTAVAIASSSNSIIEIQQEASRLSNIKVIQIEAQGMKSSKWSRSCLDRLLKLIDFLKNKHPDIGIITLKKYAEDLDLDCWWWRDNRGTNKFLGKNAIATLGTPQVNLGAARDEYFTLFATTEGFDRYYQGKVEAEFTQVVGRFRAHLYQNRSFTIYCIGTELNLEYLEQLGCQIEKSNVVELCPEAATRRERDKYKLVKFCEALLRAGEKITQKAIASGLGVTQGWISKLFDGESISWREFIALFQSLYRENIDSGIIDDRSGYPFLIFSSRIKEEYLLVGLLSSNHAGGKNFNISPFLNDQIYRKLSSRIG